MAYSFSSAIALRKDPSSGWQSVNPMTVTLGELLTTYQRIIVTLTNSFEVTPTLFDLIANRHRFNNPSLTFSAWLINNGNLALPSVGSALEVTTQQTNTGDLYAHGFKVRRVHPSGHPDMEYPLEDKTDALITKPGTDYLYMGSRSLVSLNGLFHLTEGSTHGLYVRDAVKSAKISGDVAMSITSFANIAELQLVPISTDMVFKTNPDQRLYKQTFVNLGVPTVGKTVLLSIGGYLHCLDSAYREIGDGVVSIDFTKLPLLERLFESLDLIDMHTLNDVLLNGFKNTVIIDQITSDEFITKYLTLSQSFAIVVDTDYLVVNRDAFTSTKFPGQYISTFVPRGLLVTETGKELPYTVKEDTEWFSVNTKPLYTAGATYHSTQWPLETAVSNIPDPNIPVRCVKPTHIRLHRESLIVTP
jgi:hypothetical protein